MNKNPLICFIKEDHFEINLYLTFLFSKFHKESKEIAKEQTTSLDRSC
ncbi:hypothetical protein NCCP28_00190 [Niallia sp. NCCP-28]|nr:hypothetical protein NCCP28_00190 [Niallia sp. NCCP-28]